MDGTMSVDKKAVVCCWLSARAVETCYFQFLLRFIVFNRSSVFFYVSEL